MSKEHIHFVTGKLAEQALKRQVERLSSEKNFTWSIQVLPITVAALMSPAWIADRIEIPTRADRVLIPGYCSKGLESLSSVCKVPVQVGPKDLRDLDQFFGAESGPAIELEDYRIEIIAEINHAPRLRLDQILDKAKKLEKNGADVIDVGCEPGFVWHDVGETVCALKDLGMRVSIDSLQPDEIALAAKAGAELVLSVNSENREFARDWGIEVVAIPDEPDHHLSLEQTVDDLLKHEVPLRLDPILEPIGFGFAHSLRRYMDARNRWPDLPIMMGVGNLTELSDVDSAGINFLLLAICEELKIESVLTTEVINWCQSAVKECDLARRILHYSISNQVPPKRLDDRLVCLRDPKISELDEQLLNELVESIKDNSVRTYADGESVHLIAKEFQASSSDPFVVFDRFAQSSPKNLDASHAFYLGYELCKAMIANQLGKNYVQDEALNWGHLTKEENDRHRIRKKKTD